MKITIKTADNGFVVEVVEKEYDEEHKFYEDKITNTLVFTDTDQPHGSLISMFSTIADYLGYSDSRYDAHRLFIATVFGDKCTNIDEYSNYDWRLQMFAEHFKDKAEEIVKGFEEALEKGSTE